MGVRSIVKKLIPHGLFLRVEPAGHWLEAVLWSIVYGFPARGLKTIGVTGTNGKTSTTFMIHKMLNQSGIRAGLMTTVGYGVGDDVNQQIHHMTNVPVREFLQRIKQMRRGGMDWLVLESTAHGLAQHRMFGVEYSVAVMTNVTHEHLDYFGTFERYRDAKRKLFRLADKNRNGLRTGVINADDPAAALFAGDIANPVLYGTKEADVVARDVKLEPSRISYTAVAGDDKYDIVCQIPGSFNVSNTLAVVCVGRVLGLSSEQIEQGIAALKGVEGRMTNIDEGQNFTVIVDFAHTPDSFDKLLSDIKPTVKGKLIVMFGSAGRRDEAKRAEQGKLAGQYADEVIVTEEDDRDEDGDKIMNQIASGAEETGKIRESNLFLVADRTEAISFAVKRAKMDDVVLLLGKGHEKTIERADGEHPWDEISTAHAALKNLKS